METECSEAGRVPKGYIGLCRTSRVSLVFYWYPGLAGALVVPVGLLGWRERRIRVVGGSIDAVFTNVLLEEVVLGRQDHHRD